MDRSLKRRVRMHFQVLDLSCETERVLWFSKVKQSRGVRFVIGIRIEEDYFR